MEGESAGEGRLREQRKGDEIEESAASSGEDDNLQLFRNFNNAKSAIPDKLLTSTKTNRQTLTRASCCLTLSRITRVTSWR